MGNAPQRNTCWLFGGIGYFLPCGQYGLGTFFGSVKPVPIDDDCWVYYINTDLMLTAPVNLAPLAQAMAPGDLPEESISCLHDSQADGDLYRSVFEAFGPQGSYPTPDESIRALLDAIEQLPQALQPLWQACTKKTLDIGYNSGVTPGSVSHPIPIDTLLRMQSLGIDLCITVYSVGE